MKEKILPSVVLTLVCAIVCGLLAVANVLTRDKIAQAEEDKIRNGLVSVFGQRPFEPLDMYFDGVNQVYQSDDIRIFDIVTDGYSKGGIHALIGIDESGAITAVGIISCGETAGVGTKITAPDYLAAFRGVSDESGYPDMISGATFSSQGLRNAVTLALECSREFQGGAKNG